MELKEEKGRTEKETPKDSPTGTNGVMIPKAETPKVPGNKG